MWHIGCPSPSTFGPQLVAEFEDGTIDGSLSTTTAGLGSGARKTGKMCREYRLS